MPDRRMARADLVTGAILFVLAVAMLYGSWTMDRLAVRHINPVSAPGLTPGLLALALLVASILLIMQAVRAGGLSAGADSARDTASPGGVRRLATALILCLIYPLVLIGRMPFWLATALFVFGFVAVFEWEGGGGGASRARRLAVAAAIGIVTGAAVAYTFSHFFLVRLP